MPGATRPSSTVTNSPRSVVEVATIGLLTVTTAIPQGEDEPFPGKPRPHTPTRRAAPLHLRPPRLHGSGQRPLPARTRPQGDSRPDVVPVEPPDRRRRSALSRAYRPPDSPEAFVDARANPHTAGSGRATTGTHGTPARTGERSNPREVDDLRASSGRPPAPGQQIRLLAPHLTESRSVATGVDDQHSAEQSEAAIPLDHIRLGAAELRSPGTDRPRDPGSVF